MKKMILALAAPLTLGSAAAGTALDAQTRTRTVVTHRTATVRHRTVVRHRVVRPQHHRVCRTVTRHHKRIRTCTTR
jgi:Ni/Co efflux regulator RcnB